MHFRRDSVSTMSLWTPDGERQVPPAGDEGGAGNPAAAPADDLTPEQEEQARAMAKQLAEARERILEADVSEMLANHAYGIYELAAIHLTADEPDLAQARMAIDALSAMVKALSGRIGEHEANLSQALQQVELIYVQRASQPAPQDGQD